MKKEVLKKVMKNHLICSEDEAIEAIEFVMELLEKESEHIENTEPYATNTIETLNKSYRNIRDLQENF